MTTSSPADAGRYLSLRDYLRVLRRYALLIAAIGALGAIAGYVTAKNQTPVYDASATVAFQDPTQNLSIVGLGTSSSQTPAQLASIAAETMTRPELMNAVRQRLRTTVPASSLAASVGATVSSSSGLLGITAAGSTPSFAASLANAVAQELVAQDNHATQLQFAAIAADVRRRIAALGHPAANSANSTQLTVYQDELARLATLSSFAKSAEVAEPATAPGAASSPHVSRSLVIGLILGLLLGIAAAFGRDAIDRRLRSAQDIRASFDLPIVGHVRTQAMGRIAHFSGRSGKDRAVDREAFRILRRNVEFLDPERPPRVVLVTSAVPEEGKTTVAGSLAFSLASTGRRTLLVDADLRRATLTSRIGTERSPGLVDFLTGSAGLADIVRLTEFGEPDEAPSSSPSGNGRPAEAHSFAFVPAGAPNSRAAELLGSGRLKQFLEAVAAEYDAVVIDSCPLLPVSDTLELLPHVEAILMCARSSHTTREQAAAARTVLGRYPERPTGLVITGIRARDDEYEAYAYTHASG